MKKQQLAGIGFVLLYLAAVTPIQSHQNQKEAVIETAAQLQHWCKALSYKYFKKRHQTPYNWSARTVRALNDFRTSGFWKVNNQPKVIQCHISKGLKAKYTKMDIINK